MAVTSSTAAVTETVDGPKLRTRTSFSSIVVGTLVAISVGILLHFLGTAVGLSTIDAVDRSSPRASTLMLMAGGWSLLASVLALGTGGYVAARLSGNMDRQDAALHGLGVWGATVGVSALVAGLIAASAATVTTNAIGSMVGGTVRGALTAAGTGAAAMMDPDAPRQDFNAMAERLRATLSAPSDPQAMSSEQRAAEIAALIARRVTEGSFGTADRERLSSLIALEAGIPASEADQRITAYERQAQEAAARAEQRAREAADAAALAGAVAAFWMFAALLIGAAAAVVGALQGARDGAVLIRSRDGV